MLINLTTDYAVRVVLNLAARESIGLVTSADIARDESIPPTYIPKILQALSRAGILVTYPGRNGGAKLLRAAKDISVFDVVQAMERDVVLNRCLLREGECPRDRVCAVHGVWQEAQEELHRRLKQANIAKLAEKARANLSEVPEA